jgi:biopolymer transport protein ExbD
MNYLLEVCLPTALAIGIMPLIAQSNPDAVPTMQKGISVQMPVTSTALPMPEADKADAILVIITEDGSIYLGLHPTDADALADSVADALSKQSDKSVYIKADARAPYSQVATVLAALRTAGVEAPTLLTAQPHASEPGSLVPPECLQILIDPHRSSSSPAIVQLLNSAQQQALLKVNGEPVSRASVQNKLAQIFHDRSDHDRSNSNSGSDRRNERETEKFVQIESDGTFPFAAVVDLIDQCRSAGAKVVLSSPTI